jgi:hypothetical protein
VSEQVFHNFRSSSLTSFFLNFWKVWNRTNSEIFKSLEFSEIAVFNPKTWVSELFDPKTENYFRTFFASSKNWLFLNFKKQTFPKLAKMKSSEISV